MNELVTSPAADPQITREARLVEYRWRVAAVDGGPLYGPGAVCATLSVSHWADRRCFQASIYPATVYAKTTVMRISLLGGRGWTFSEPTARFSAKAFAAFADRALAAFRTAFEAGDAHVVKLFTLEPMQEVAV